MILIYYLYIMLKFKLMRFGKKREPHYRIVVNEARDKRQGEYVDLVGTYDPLEKPAVVKLEKDKIKDWISKGVKPTETVHDLFAKEGLLDARKRVRVERKSKAEIKASKKK